MSLPTRELGKENYFEHDADIGIIGRGETIESSFTDAAHAMFALMGDLAVIRPLQIITFDFIEEDIEVAFVTWLNLLVAKAQERQLLFCDFRLKKEGNLWKATVSGEPWREEIERGLAVKGASPAMLSVKKIDHVWQAQCLVDV